MTNKEIVIKRKKIILNLQIYKIQLFKQKQIQFLPNKQTGKIQ